MTKKMLFKFIPKLIKAEDQYAKRKEENNQNFQGYSRILLLLYWA